MSVIRFPITESDDPATVWPGVTAVDPAGVELAVGMFAELEDNEEGPDGINEGDPAVLEDWPREGTPFRNIVLEYLQRARDRGPEVEGRILPRALRLREHRRPGVRAVLRRRSISAHVPGAAARLTQIGGTV
jgi:hypothetical protein